MLLARLALAALLLLAVAPARAASPTGAGLATAGAAAGGMVVGGVGGGFAWALLDTPDCSGTSNDLCAVGGVYRGIAFGVPLGGGLTSAAAGTLGHQLVVGRGAGRVLLAGLAPVAVGGLLRGGAVAVARGGERYGVATALVVTGGAVSLLGPTLTTGLTSAAVTAAPARTGPQVGSVSVTPVEGGVRLGVGGHF